METINWSITTQWDWFTVQDMLFTYNEEEQVENRINKLNAQLILNPQFIPVYPSMIRDGYSYLEAILYWFINFFLSNNEKFYCSNEQLWEMLWASEKTISLAIKKLKDNGLIDITYKIKSWWGKVRFIKSPLYKNVKSDFTKMYSQSLQKCKGIENKTIENKKENIKRKFLEFVYLTDDEYNKLIDAYWERVIKEQIKNLNNYIWQNWKDKYKSHYYTILNWNRKAWIKEIPKKQDNETWIYDLPF